MVAKSIFMWFNDKNNLKFLDKLLEKVEIKTEKSQITNYKLQGKTFVFTGTLNSIERNLAKEKVRELGGQTSESISEKVDFVVVGSEPGSKLGKSQKLGVKIINEKEFLEMIA